MKYFSALDKVDQSLDYPPIERVEIRNSTAFVHNIEQGELPSVYDKCDVFYIEPPWPDGYKKFNERAGTETKTYENFISCINQAIKKYYNKPVIVICGKIALRYLVVPAYTRDIILNRDIHGNKALAIYYNFSPIEAENTIELISRLAEKFNCVGDFCCGFGTTAGIFAKAGKDFVVSDLNPRCIGFIKENANEWYENL